MQTDYSRANAKFQAWGGVNISIYVKDVSHRGEKGVVVKSNEMRYRSFVSKG